MSKTNKNEVTLNLEKQLRRNISKMGTFICPEVTIGFNDASKHGRVDILTIDTKGIARCYEVKSSVEDFKSKAKWSFVGHYNYFVCNSETYEQIKDDIPNGIGVYVDGYCKKKPKKQQVSDDMYKTILMSMIRSLSRDTDKLYKLDNPRAIEQYESTIERLRRENYRLRKNK